MRKDTIVWFKCQTCGGVDERIEWDHIVNKPKLGFARCHFYKCKGTMKQYDKKNREIQTETCEVERSPV